MIPGAETEADTLREGNGLWTRRVFLSVPVMDGRTASLPRSQSGPPALLCLTLHSSFILRLYTCTSSSSHSGHPSYRGRALRFCATSPVAFPSLPEASLQAGWLHHAEVEKNHAEIEIHLRRVLF